MTSHLITITIHADFANERILDEEIKRLNYVLDKWKKTGNYLVGREKIDFEITGKEE